MNKIKELQKYTLNLNILYVEDDIQLREDTLFLFQPFFKSIDVASNGLEGLKKFEYKPYDIVITDINMPHMNGIEMIKKIKEINIEQKVIAISAHNESNILIELIKLGVNSFILKPIIQQEVIDVLYTVSRDAYMQILNLELVNELNQKNLQLEKQLKELKLKSNTIEIKHNQLVTLLQEEPSKKEPSKETSSQKPSNEEIVIKDDVVFLEDHVEDILDDFEEITEKLFTAMKHSSQEDISRISILLSKISSTFLYYTPYLDNLASSLQELSDSIQENSQEFMDILQQEGDNILTLFDAVNSDMERYVKRFSVESMAMKNIHQIHEPTELSIKQIISLFIPDSFENSEIEFF